MSDVIGTAYGRLTVISPALSAGKERRWLCSCSCGASHISHERNLKRGRAQSCGCLQKEAVRALRHEHGFGRTDEYRIWLGIKARCTNPAAKDFARYGAKGIKIAARWLDFFCFLADMGPRPTREHSIDRSPNNEGDYEPGNCRWATRAEQQRNKVKTRTLAIDGVTLSVADWAEKNGINIRTAQQRIRKGWDVYLAVTTPTNK